MEVRTGHDGSSEKASSNLGAKEVFPRDDNGAESHRERGSGVGQGKREREKDIPGQGNSLSKGKAAGAQGTCGRIKKQARAWE